MSLFYIYCDSLVSCSGDSLTQNLQVRLSGVFSPFWFLLSITIHLDLNLKYILQLDRANLLRNCVSSEVRYSLSFDLLPACILFMHSSLIFVLITCLISFFVTSFGMRLFRPKDKQSVLHSVPRSLVLYNNSASRFHS